MQHRRHTGAHQRASDWCRCYDPTNFFIHDRDVLSTLPLVLLFFKYCKDGHQVMREREIKGREKKLASRDK